MYPIMFPINLLQDRPVTGHEQKQVCLLSVRQFIQPVAESAGKNTAAGHAVLIERRLFPAVSVQQQVDDPVCQIGHGIVLITGAVSAPCLVHLLINDIPVRLCIICDMAKRPTVTDQLSLVPMPPQNRLHKTVITAGIITDKQPLSLCQQCIPQCMHKRVVYDKIFCHRPISLLFPGSPFFSFRTAQCQQFTLRHRPQLVCLQSHNKQYAPCVKNYGFHTFRFFPHFLRRNLAAVSGLRKRYAAGLPFKFLQRISMQNTILKKKSQNESGPCPAVIDPSIPPVMTHHLPDNDRILLDQTGIEQLIHFM